MQRHGVGHACQRFFGHIDLHIPVAFAVVKFTDGFHCAEFHIFCQHAVARQANLAYQVILLPFLDPGESKIKQAGPFHQFYLDIQFIAHNIGEVYFDIRYQALFPQFLNGFAECIGAGDLNFVANGQPGNGYDQVLVKCPGTGYVDIFERVRFGIT